MYNTVLNCKYAVVPCCRVQANVGLDGDKSIENYLYAMTDAHSTQELIVAFTNLKTQSGLDKGDFVYQGMQKKKNSEFWTAEVTELWKAQCKAL